MTTASGRTKKKIVTNTSKQAKGKSTSANASKDPFEFDENDDVETKKDNDGDEVQGDEVQEDEVGEWSLGQELMAFLIGKADGNALINRAMKIQPFFKSKDVFTLYGVNISGEELLSTLRDKSITSKEIFMSKRSKKRKSMSLSEAASAPVVHASAVVRGASPGRKKVRRGLLK